MSINSFNSNPNSCVKNWASILSVGQVAPSAGTAPTAQKTEVAEPDKSDALMNDLNRMSSINRPVINSKVSVPITASDKSEVSDL